jgi:hypothetical protein
MIFVATGALLMKLRKHALESNECYDFDEKERAASLRTCCSNSALNRMGEGGEAGGGERCGGGAEGALSELSGKEKQLGEMEMPLSCKFCDEDACCRFCFGGPDKGDLIAPCAPLASLFFQHLSCFLCGQLFLVLFPYTHKTMCFSFPCTTQVVPLSITHNLHTALNVSLTKQQTQTYTRMRPLSLSLRTKLFFRSLCTRSACSSGRRSPCAPRATARPTAGCATGSTACPASPSSCAPSCGSPSRPR